MKQDRIYRMYHRILEIIEEEMPDLLNDQLTELVKSIGVDLARFGNLMNQKSAFNPYMVLGLNSSASDEEVKKRYRELLRKLHPDTAGIEGTAFLLQLVLTSYEQIKRDRGWQ